MEEGSRWDSGCLEGRAGVRAGSARSAAAGAPAPELEAGDRPARRGRRCRARGGRKPGAERPSGAPRGAETRAGRGGRVRAWAGWALGLSPAGQATRRSWCPVLSRSGVVGASSAAEVWESKKDRVPGEEKCAGEKRDLLEQAGVSTSPADRTPRRLLENFFWRLTASQASGGPRLPRRRAGQPPRGGGRGAR